MAVIPTYTIIQADGLYRDDEVEQAIFAPSASQNYTFEYLQTHLWPDGASERKPWSDVPEDIRTRVNGIEVLKMGFTAQDLELFPNLKVIVRMGVGYDRLDREALAKKGVTVCNVPDYGTAEIADHAIGLMLSMRRGILLHNDRQRLQPPDPWMVINTPLVARLQQSTLGIFGLGRIGTAVALRAKAFGFNVLFYDPYLPNGVDKSLGIERTKNIKDLFERSAVLSLHCPCTRETRGMIDYTLLSLLPPGAVLVNTARGEILNLDGVQQCLKENILAGAALDVLPEEPIPEDRVHPLIQAYRNKESWLEGRMVLTCHTAFYSPESFVDIRVKSAQTMRDVLIDGLKSNVITPEME
ncbi:3-phosphoglycerate dehydrogenase like protein [Zymoseptoria brevis]|uniref:3-phosphoglycerate dehydrogenase like protein n=1 Tax=Zymoseptoria brevis TaxID=1047168 RepID=A0A0F4H056_9PEZI|nr:3-phosphoglycerate dehydrogenase like protein [Zymoseptoria brevis]